MFLVGTGAGGKAYG